jgi:SAM-dependent methyltransferase
VTWDPGSRSLRPRGPTVDAVQKKAPITRLLPPNPSRKRLHAWLTQAAASAPPGSRVLDAGAGEAPYRHLFDHVRYESADFEEVAKPYAEQTYTCDLASIPVEDGRFDRVICSQVLEHVPEPTAVLRELRRVLRPGGELWLSAPLFYEEHERPFDFYRYTQYAWKRFASELDFELISLEWMEGYYATLSYQSSMAARVLPWKVAPLRAVHLSLAWLYAWLDERNKITDRGMPKNYLCVLRRPDSSQ